MDSIFSCHGYLAFFFWILANRIGVPLPATPALLAAGALSGLGELKFPSILLLAVIATVLSDTVWFALGRRHGSRLLQYLFRLAAQPHSVLRRAEHFIARHGTRFLLVAKFIPGMNRASLPLTGSSQVSYSRFLAFDFLGALLWASGYAGLGYVFSHELERALRSAPAISLYVSLVFALGLLVYGGVRYMKRRESPAEASTS